MNRRDALSSLGLAFGAVIWLTGGSQATIRFDFSAGFAGARWRASFCTGMRTSTEVSARLSTFSSTRAPGTRRA